MPLPAPPVSDAAHHAADASGVAATSDVEASAEPTRRVSARRSTPARRSEPEWSQLRDRSEKRLRRIGFVDAEEQDEGSGEEGEEGEGEEGDEGECRGRCPRV